MAGIRPSVVFPSQLAALQPPARHISDLHAPGLPGTLYSPILMILQHVKRGGKRASTSAPRNASEEVFIVARAAGGDQRQHAAYASRHGLFRLCVESLNRYAPSPQFCIIFRTIFPAPLAVALLLIQRLPHRTRVRFSSPVYWLT